MTNLKTLIAAALVAASSTAAFADSNRSDSAHLYSYGPTAPVAMIEGRNAAEITFPNSNDNGQLSDSIYAVQRQVAVAIEGRNAADFRPVAPDVSRAGSDR